MHIATNRSPSLARARFVWGCHVCAIVDGSVCQEIVSSNKTKHTHAHNRGHRLIILSRRPNKRIQLPHTRTDTRRCRLTRQRNGTKWACGITMDPLPSVLSSHRYELCCGIHYTLFCRECCIGLTCPVCGKYGVPVRKNVASRNWHFVSHLST